MQNKHVVGPHGLTWLEGQVRHELNILSHNYKPWVPSAKGPHSEPVLDVLIVGGGLYGLGLAWGLLRSKVTVVSFAPLPMKIGEKSSRQYLLYQMVLLVLMF